MKLGPKGLIKLLLGGVAQLLWLLVPPFIFFWMLHTTVLGWEYSTVTIFSTQYVANYFLLCSIWCAFSIFIKRRLFSLFFASVFFESIAQINIVKSKYLFHPILPSDLFFIKNAPILVNFIPTIFWCLLGVTLLASMIAMFKRGKVELGRNQIIKILQPTIVVLGFILALSLGTDRFKELRTWVDAHPSNYDQNYSYRTNGFLVGFLLNASTLKIQPPDNYTPTLPTKFVKYENCTPEINIGVKKNIIVVMLEAFWDPTLSGEVFSEDPVPNYRRLAKVGQTISLISPVFGGGTANAEFEVLTGLSTVFFPVGSVPFQQYISRPIRALPKILSDEGYSTVAIHNFHKYFWNREYAYQKLGFDRFIAVEDFGGYDEVEKDAGWPSDKLVFDKIVDELRTADSPKFVYGVTVSTHMPFNEGGSTNVKVVNPRRIFGDDLIMLEAYANRVKKVDEYIGNFISAVNSLPNPSIVVLLPDHQPQVAVPLSKPIDVWAEPNQSLRKVEGLVLGEINAVSLGKTESFNCLPAKIFRWSGLGLGKFMQFTEDFCQENPIVSPAFPIPVNSAMFDAFHWLTYDRVFGMGYSEPKRVIASCSKRHKQEAVALSKEMEQKYGL